MINTNNQELAVLLFQSIHQVMKAESIIARHGFKYQIIPVPSKFSSECGMCIEMNYSDTINLLIDLQQYGLEPKIVKK